MTTNRVSTIVLMLAITAVALVTASFASPKAVRPSDDFALRHPKGLSDVSANLAAYYLGSDYAARHPELSRLGNSVDSSDYFLRHQELRQTVDPSDYALRHPEWVFAPQAIDTSDFFLRHPELSAAVVDTTDYFLRHLEFIGQ